MFYVMESAVESWITIEEFGRLDIRSGVILEAEEFPKAKKPAYKLRIDFGGLGVRTSSARITRRYRTADLVGRTVVAVVNLPPRQVADFVSEVLVLGVADSEGHIVLLTPSSSVKSGSVVS